MRHILRTIITISTVVAFIGCHNPVHNSLNQAEAIMEQDPDSALTIIYSIDSTTVTSVSDRAFYALLSTQALVKTNAYPTDDSLISTAVNHYESFGSDSNLMKSLFYQAQVRLYDRNYTGAIIPAMKAREMAVDMDNSYWRAKASELIADLFNFTYYHAEAIEYRKDAIAQYGNVGKTANQRFSLCDLAMAYVDIHDYETGLNLADSIYNIATELEDTALALYSAKAAFIGHYKLKDYREADSIATYLIRYQHIQPMSGIDKAYAALSRMYTGNYKEADSLVRLYYQDSLNINRLMKFIFLTSYYESIDDSYQSRRFQDSASVEQDSIVARLIRQSIISRQRDYMSD